MKRRRSILFLITWMALIAAGATRVRADELPRSAQKSAPTDEEIVALWSDRPEYKVKLDLKSRPRLISGAPLNSPAFLDAGTTLRLYASIAITESGEVAGVRIMTSDDPRLNQVVRDGIQKWKFSPAVGATGPMKSILLLPITFRGPPPAPERNLNVSVRPLSYDMRRSSLYGTVVISGPAVRLVKSARVIVANAVDDTGTNVTDDRVGAFFLPSVGRTSDGELTGSVLSNPSFGLQKPSPYAKEVRSLDATLELVMPGQDPGATVHIDELPKKMGMRLQSAELSAAGVSILLLDKASCARALADPAATNEARNFLATDLSQFPPELAKIIREQNRDPASVVSQ